MDVSSEVFLYLGDETAFLAMEEIVERLYHHYKLSNLLPNFSQQSWLVTIQGLKITH